MRKDHRPYIIKKAYLKFQKFFAHRFLRPQFDFLGKGAVFIKPWHVELFGAPIRLGNWATVISSPDNKVRFSVWPGNDPGGRIEIGDYSLICPGVRLGAASGIFIGDSCMLANGVYITDSDWHGLYDRISTGKTLPVKIEDNVWIGDSAIVCKGVTIGKNSVIGAGAVVVDDISENVVAAGNPARVVKRLDPDRNIIPRAEWYSDPLELARYFDGIDRALLKENTFLHWLRYLVSPGRRD